MKSLVLLGMLVLLASPVAMAEKPVDINTADAETLATAMTGVGPTTAAAIVRYRQQHGPFASVDDLTKVRGIGEKTLAKSRDNLTTGQATR